MKASLSTVDSLLKRIAFLFALNLFAIPSLTQPAISPSQIKKIERQLDELIETQNDKRLNGSILIAQDGEVLIQKYYGWVDADSTSLIDHLSRFNIGSLAKEVPGMLIFDLIQQGVLDYEDRLSKFFPSLQGWANAVKVKHLLFYRSGLPTINFREIKNDTLAMDYLNSLPELLSQPDSLYIYSNWNNFLLAKIIESVNGVNYQDYVQEAYFKKLGIHHALFGSTMPRQTENMTLSFTDELGHDITSNPNFKIFQLCYSPLYMNINDVLRWLEYVKDTYTKLDNKSTLFFKPTTIRAQGALGALKYANDKVHIHAHGGYAYSFGTSTYSNYKSGLVLIVMTNNNKRVDPIELSEKILQLLLVFGIK